VSQGLAARNQPAAARTAAWIYVASALATLFSNVIIPANVPGGTLPKVLAYSAPVPLLLIAGLLVSRRSPSWLVRRILLFTPAFGVALVVGLDLLTHDVGVDAQVTFCLPVIYAASQLRALGAWCAALLAIAGDLVVLLRLDWGSDAVLDLVNLSLVILLMTGLLSRAGERQDLLVRMLEQQAAVDALTGLATRRALDDAAVDVLAAAGKIGTSLIMLDVDHFKSINDNHGHLVGDDALQHVARLVLEHARPDAVVGRMGGDELAMLLPNCPEEFARAGAAELVDAVRDSPLPVPGLAAGLQLSISVGVAHAGRETRRLRDLYLAADSSLYQAKRAGRGRVGGTSDVPRPRPAETVESPDAEAAGAGAPPAERSPAERSEAGRSEAGRSEVGRSEAGRSEAGRSEVGRSEVGRSEVASEGLPDGSFEVGDVLDRVAPGDLGLSPDDRVDHG
jgi:diguanylate cyclase (GGDEF)-like protein